MNMRLKLTSIILPIFLLFKCLDLNLMLCKEGRRKFRFCEIKLTSTLQVSYMSSFLRDHDGNIIDDNLLKQAICDANGKIGSFLHTLDERIDFFSITYLRLEFKNILAIENLDPFTNLTKLHLSNNLIKFIDGIQFLINLKWLDLSFNEIQRMERLDHLIKLEDLCLTHNRIEVIEGVDNLLSLEILTLGSNLISAVDNVACLRVLIRLRTLRLDGNPISKEPYYLEYVISRLPNLIYLDFRLISMEDRLQADDRYFEDIKLLAESAKENEILRIQKKTKKREKNLAEAAFIDGMKGPEFYNFIIYEDLPWFTSLPGMQELADNFRDKIIFTSKECARYGLIAKEERDNDLREFMLCIQQLISKNENLSIELISNFKSKRNKQEYELSILQDDNLVYTSLCDLRRGTIELFDMLVKNEMVLVDQIDFLFQDFERHSKERMELFLEQIRAFMSQCREYSQEYSEKLNEIAINCLEQFNKGQLEFDLNDEILRLLVDKESLGTTLSASHDCHMSTIDKKEDNITLSINNYINKQIHDILDDETNRNRLRIVEINNLIDTFNELIDETEENLKLD